MQIAISPFTITKAGISGSAVLLVLTNPGDLDTINQTVHFDFALFDADGNVLQHGQKDLTPDQYNNWAGQVDGVYLPSCIATNLSLSPISP